MVNIYNIWGLVPYYTCRCRAIYSLNPLPYRAMYFGEKVHLDQNEKCVMFGVTHVVAIDGCSRKIVGFVTIPKKNPILIYDMLFRPLLLSQGLWDNIAFVTRALC